MEDDKPVPKPVFWMGTSRKDLKDCNNTAQDKIGTALQQVQYGFRPATVKTLSGFGSANVLEIKISDAGNAYRAICTVRFAEYIFVLHVFQKKSNHGIQTAKQDVEKIQARLKMAEAAYQELTAHKSEEQ